MSGQMTSVQSTVSRRLAELLAADPSRDDRARAAHHVLDWTGCAIAGAASNVGRSLVGAFPKTEGDCVLVSGGASDVRAAAFENGALGNVLEMDDVDKRAILHPGPVLIPAAFAVADQEGASADAFLDAIVRGYEAVIRLGRAVGPQHYAYWHNTGTCGPVGAAAAAGSLLNLDPRRMTSALGLAATAAGGLWRTRHEPNSMAKQLHTAKAAEAGVSAAYLAAAGIIGPEAIFEGEQGFFAAMCEGADSTDILKDYGAGWRIHEVSFKPWAACRHAHAAIDAALELRDRVAPRVSDIASIDIQTYRDAVVFCDCETPQTVGDAKFSLQHAVAVTLLDGAPSLASFERDAYERADIAALRARSRVEAVSQFSDAYPARYGARVRVTFKDGMADISDAPDAWGDPENPIDEATLVSKAQMLAIEAGGLAPSSANKVIDAALGLSKPGESFAAYRDALKDMRS
ncbi:MAG: MmgE/PrpD family protein [Pseudomonadota bacterium]